MTTVDRLTIVGLGLLGGSIAKAAKARGVAGHITAVGRHPETLETARAEGSVDAWTLDLREGVADADLIILATPVAAIEALLPDVWEAAGEEALVSDVGSIKGRLTKAVEALTARGSLTFLGAHPMAGSEQSGYRAARGDLFNGSTVILTPTETTPVWAAKRLAEFWERLGGRVTTLTPELHDRIVAAVSHLPHLVAYALVDAVAKAPDTPLAFAAQGFKDSTRIAASDPTVWREIFLANREAILEALREFRRSLDELTRLINEAEEATLGRELSRIRSIRTGIT